MHEDNKSVLLISMPFAGINIPSIQLQILESYLIKRGINSKTNHLYLKAAEYYGLNNYFLLSNTSGISYAAQMAFSKYVFRNHWNIRQKNFKNYFNKYIQNSNFKQNDFSFEKYMDCTENFFRWITNNNQWKEFDIIGFSLNYGQFLPSLAVAKKIKEKYPEKKIIFGGGRTVGKLGIKVLEAFDFVDFIVSGDGEEALYLLASDYLNYSSIPNLIFRVGDKVVWNNSDFKVNFNETPLINYDSFYKDLANSSVELQKYFQLHGRLPVEISRGCWWNKCTFCNLNLQHKCYREKKVERIVEELEFLSTKYKVLNFHLIGNTLPKNNYKNLLEEIKKIGKDFSFFVEARSGDLKSSDYKLLKDAGFVAMQTGIEAFSQNYLNKMNKGVRVIDNIASLKFCNENGIKNEYNLIYQYPNEDKIDFEESKKNIMKIMQFIDPPQLNNLLVGFGSYIFDNYSKFNIKKLDFTDIDQIMFPPELLDKGFIFYYSFIKRKETKENNWQEIIDLWIEYNKKSYNDCLTKNTFNFSKFYFVDGGNFIKIYDKRDYENTRIFVLDELEREIFLSCLDIISHQELEEKFSDVPDYKITAILRTLENNNIIFKEEDYYLSLPLQYNIKPAPLSKKQITLTAV